MGAGGTAADKNGKFSHLHRFLTALKHSDDRRDGDSQTLASYIEAERRDLDAEAFALLDRELQSRIGSLAKRCAPLNRSRALTLGSLCPHAQESKSATVHVITCGTTATAYLPLQEGRPDQLAETRSVYAQSWLQPVDGNHHQKPQCALLCSNDPLDKKTALLAIDELIRAKATVDNSARVVALARCIKTVMNSCSDNRILKQAAQARAYTRTCATDRRFPRAGRVRREVCGSPV